MRRIPGHNYENKGLYEIPKIVKKEEVERIEDNLLGSSIKDSLHVMSEEIEAEDENSLILGLLVRNYYERKSDDSSDEDDPSIAELLSRNRSKEERKS